MVREGPRLAGTELRPVDLRAPRPLGFIDLVFELDRPVPVLDTPADFDLRRCSVEPLAVDLRDLIVDGGQEGVIRKVEEELLAEPAELVALDRRRYRLFVGRKLAVC